MYKKCLFGDYLLRGKINKQLPPELSLSWGLIGENYKMEIYFQLNIEVASAHLCVYCGVIQQIARKPFFSRKLQHGPSFVSSLTKQSLGLPFTQSK